MSRKEILVVGLVLIFSAIAHGVNMFNFPYYENDEGTYMSQAWAVAELGKLTPYTYWYDHAPLGWFLIALWVKLTGGFFAFGDAINSGRALMLVIHLASSVLVYYITKRLSGKTLAAVLSVFVFSLSPLAIYFQRRVLLDNIMAFWVLTSLAILLKEKLKLTQVVASAIIFAVATLTKESAIFLAPAFLYTLFTRTHSHHKSFALASWTILAGLIIASYPLYALLNNEFFSVGFMGDNTPHVSLITTIKTQLARGNKLAFWMPGSDFYGNLLEWYRRDSLLVVSAIIATTAGLLFSLKKEAFRIPTLFVILFILFLLKGGLIINFYVVPLIPLLGIEIGLVAESAADKLSWGRRVPYLLIAGLTLIFFSATFSGATTDHFWLDETEEQTKAINWVRENVPNDAFIIVDDYAYLDLKKNGGFENAHWYFKVLYDPEITQVFGRNLEKTQYILLSHNMLNDFRIISQNDIERLFKEAEKVKQWGPAETTYLNLTDYFSTNGDWAILYRYEDRAGVALEKSWEYYKKNFINETGATFDPVNGNAVTSEAVSYTLLRAVWMNDRMQFDKTWEWTKKNLQLANGLFVWHLPDALDGQLAKAEIGSATDADQDIALALVFAHKKWGGGVSGRGYLTEAVGIIEAIWENEVKMFDGAPYLVAGDWAKREPIAIINPSYLAPYAYRIFAELDQGNDWMRLVDTSYDAYLACSQASLDRIKSVGLPPDWCAIERGGKTVPSPIPGSSTDYSFDAFRGSWRLALDYKWNGEERAKKILEASDFLLDEWKSKNKVVSEYTHDGVPIVGAESTAAYGANIGYFMIKDQETAKEIYQDKLLSDWDEPSNYYTQNWAWFGTALYSDKLPNLWVE